MSLNWNSGMSSLRQTLRREIKKPQFEPEQTNDKKNKPADVVLAVQPQPIDLSVTDGKVTIETLLANSGVNINKTKATKNENVATQEKTENTIAAMIYNMEVELNSEADNKLVQYLKDNIQWIGGKKGDELTSQHVANFLTHIDGTNGDGLITRDEIQAWLDANGHGAKFGTIDDIFNMLKDLMKSDSTVYEVKSYDEYLQAIDEASYRLYSFNKDTVISIFDDNTNFQNAPEEYKEEIYKQALLLFSQNEINHMDKSGDGIVTEKEYAEYSPNFDNTDKQWFKNIDTDNDGNLETEELAATYAYQDWENGEAEGAPNQYNGEFMFTGGPEFENEELIDDLIKEREAFETKEQDSDKMLTYSNAVSAVKEMLATTEEAYLATVEAFKEAVAAFNAYATEHNIPTMTPSRFGIMQARRNCLGDENALELVRKASEALDDMYKADKTRRKAKINLNAMLRTAEELRIKLGIESELEAVKLHIKEHIESEFIPFEP